MTMERKRSDHRTKPWGGAFGDYLLNEYKNRQDWAPSGPIRFDITQLHKTARNSSGFSELAGGIPDMKTAWVNHLSGNPVPWQAVEAAIEMARESDPEAIAVLEYYQLPESRRIDRYKFAFSQNCAEQTLSDRFKRAVRKVKENLWLARTEWEGR